MSTPRRRLIRPSSSDMPAQSARQIAKLQDRLHKERSSLSRWQVRLKRAFNAVQKSQKRIARIERQIARLSS